MAHWRGQQGCALASPAANAGLLSALEWNIGRRTWCSYGTERKTGPHHVSLPGRTIGDATGGGYSIEWSDVGACSPHSRPLGKERH